MRNHLTAAIAATMSLATLDAAAAPTSMMHTLPTRAPAAQAAPAERGAFSWATKWFRDKPVEQAAAAEGIPAGVVAYQPPASAEPMTKPATSPIGVPSEPGAPQQVAMNNAWHGFGGMPTPTVSTPSATTPIHQAPRTPIAQVTPSLGGPDAMRASTPADEARALREQGHDKDRAGDLAGAEQLYRQALSTDPSSAASVNDLGLCLARQGKLEASVAVLRQAVMMRPDKQLYRNNIATVLVELGKTDEALSHLQAVSSPAAAHYNVGQLFARSGKSEEAKVQFAKAIQIDPSLGAAHEALAKLGPQAAPTLPPIVAPEPIAVAQAAPALPPLPRQTPADDVTPIATSEAGKEVLSGPPSFPRLLPPVLSR